MAGSHESTASELAGLVQGKHVTIMKAACLFTAKSREACSAFLVNSPPPRAVSGGGRLRASGDDSHGLSLEVGIRVGPHIGVIFISDIIAGKQM